MRSNPNRIALIESREVSTCFIVHYLRGIEKSYWVELNSCLVDSEFYLNLRCYRNGYFGVASLANGGIVEQFGRNRSNCSK